VKLRHGQNFARDLWAGRARPDEFNSTSFIVFIKLMMKDRQLFKRRLRLLLRMSPPLNSARVTFTS
jgi:hypothetical protein